jgi:hypothetical protein
LTPAVAKLVRASFNPEAHWTQSGWHGWVYGWTRHLVTGVAAMWSPVTAELTAAHHADNAIALLLVPELRPEAPFILGDTASADPALHQRGSATGRIVITPCRGPYPHADDVVRAWPVGQMSHPWKALIRKTQPDPPSRYLSCVQSSRLPITS